MTTYTTVPALTDQDLGKVLLANYLKDGDPAGWFAPPFLLDKAFQVASNDGLTAVVAYRAGEPYAYTVKGIPLVTKTLKYAAIPSIVSGLVATKDGTNGVALTAGVVRYLNAAKEWKEVNVGAQTVLIGVPSTGVETVYIVAYDLETTPKIDAYKPAKSLFDAAPNAATVDPQEPAIIVARVDLDGAGNVIAIFNDGIHAGLEATKAEDLREMIGVIQHNIEPKIESKLKTTLSYSDLPDRYIIGYTNFGKAKQDNRFPYIGAMVDTKPTNVNTEFMDSAGNAIIQASGNIASQELSRYTSASNPSGERLKRGQFVLHPIFVYLDIENTPIINYAIVRSAVVFRKRPLATEPLSEQIRKYMLEETLGNTEVPQFITDFCTLCGFFVVDDAMDLRTNIAEALIVPATEGFSSIQERPSSLSAPTAAEEGLLVVKEGDTAIAKGLPAADDGAVYTFKDKVGLTTFNINKLKFLTLKIPDDPSRDWEGFTDRGAISSSDLSTMRNYAFSISPSKLNCYTQIGGRNKPTTVLAIFEASGNSFTKKHPSPENTQLQAETRLYIPLPTSIPTSRLFGAGESYQSVVNKLVHFDIYATYYSGDRTASTTQSKTVKLNNNLSAKVVLPGQTPLGRLEIGVVPSYPRIELDFIGWISNINWRIMDADLENAVVQNGVFTNYGTVKGVYNPIRINKDTGSVWTATDPYSKIIPNIESFPRYYDTNRVIIKDLANLKNFNDRDASNLPGHPDIQVTKTASTITASINSVAHLVYLIAGNKSQIKNPSTTTQVDIFFEMVWS